MSGVGPGLLRALLAQTGLPIPAQNIKASGNEIVIEFTKDDVKSLILNYVTPERKDIVARYLDVRIEGDRLKVVITL